MTSTRRRDDGSDSRRVLEARAVLVDADLRKGRAIHEALLDHLGDCPPHLLPHQEVKPTPELVTVGEYFETIWIKRKVPPAVRVSAAKRHRRSFQSVILPRWRDVPLVQITTVGLIDFQTELFRRQVRGRPITVKTVRNLIDWHFRALHRDARDIDHLVEGDPFARVPWPRMPRKKPDPFLESERDAILDFCRRKRPLWYPFVYFQFWTGCRPSENVGAADE